MEEGLKELSLKSPKERTKYIFSQGEQIRSSQSVERDEVRKGDSACLLGRAAGSWQ